MRPVKLPGKAALTAEMLRQYLAYDKHTGIFTRLIQTTPAIKVRDVPRRINRQNLRGALPTSKSGLLGAHPSFGKYSARIGLDGAQHVLGRFDTKEEAHEAYLSAKRRMHVGCAI